MLTGIHFLLTYTCNFQCDTCFLYCGPEAKGTFTIKRLRHVFDEIEKIRTVEWVYFEGGEAFLYYPVMLEGIRITKGMGLKAGIVTNSYWATSIEDAELWLKPICELGLDDLSVSDDLFHHDKQEDNPAKLAATAAKNMGLPVSSICIESPKVEPGTGTKEKGKPVIGGGAKFRGRAVEKLTPGLPTRNWREFTECPYEDLEDPGRVHLDPFGNVQICQGLSMGNMWDTDLSRLVQDYDPHAHPICGPLIQDGPARLAKEFNVQHEDNYVDECHFCYMLRLALLEKLPRYLAPRQVYGLE